SRKPLSPLKALVAQSLQLFEGDAQTWYHQLGSNAKHEMVIDLEHALIMVEERFKMNEFEAPSLLDKAAYTMEDDKQQHLYHNPEPKNHTRSTLIYKSHAHTKKTSI
ncbi:hypothetical protein LQW54_011989, partial [Pestalotiopsis sp. IQ-011]